MHYCVSDKRLHKRKDFTSIPWGKDGLMFYYSIIILLYWQLKSIQTIEDEERRMRSSTDNTVDVVLKTNIEGIIVKWGVQVLEFMKLIMYHHVYKFWKVNEVLSLASEDALKNGATPGPMTEVEFWEAKCFNLESLHEQVKSKH